VFEETDVIHSLGLVIVCQAVRARGKGRNRADNSEWIKRNKTRMLWRIRHRRWGRGSLMEVKEEDGEI
jgi:hypothetical protein